MRRHDMLFCEPSLSDILRAQREGISRQVGAIPKNQFMNAKAEEVTENVAGNMRVDPLIIYEDRMEMDQVEAEIDVSGWGSRNHFREAGPIYVPGTMVTFNIPFTGDSNLWRRRPNQYQTAFPYGTPSVSSGKDIGDLKILLERPSDEPATEIKRRLDEQLVMIRFYLSEQWKEIEGFNGQLIKWIRPEVDARRARIQEQDQLQTVLNIPLKRRPGAPPVTPIRLTRSLVRPLPPAPKSGYKEEPGILDEDYNHILSVIRHEGRTFETSPGTFAIHDEEGLRDILLAHLNGHYQGEASAETFRRNGKTDIRIADGDRAAFVAECKIWRGPKEIPKALDQLLGYLTWRDCKASLVIFNKDKADFSSILTDVPGLIEAHPNFRKLLLSEKRGEWQYSMTSREDAGRLIRVHVFAVNLYTPKHPPNK